MGQEKLPDWNRLWDDFTQEEIREGSQGRDPDRSQDSTEDPNIALHAKGKGKKKKDLSKVRCFGCQQKGHYVGQCPNKKGKEVETSASAAVEEFLEKFEEFSYMACLGGFGCMGFSGSLSLFLDIGATRHMTGMRNVFLSYSELSPGSYVGCGVCTGHRLVVKGVERVKFRLESGGYMELVEVLYVPRLPMNILSNSEFEMDRCGLVYHDGVVDLYPNGVSSGTKLLISVRMERLYKFLGNPVVVDTSGWLDLDTDNGEDSVRESHMDISHDQSSVQGARDGSVSEGASAAENVMAEETDHGGGVVRRSSLTKREC